MRDPFAPLDVVSITDPGVHFESDADRSEYFRSREPSLWKPVEGRRAAVFRVQPLSAEAAVKLAGFDAITQTVLAFRLCVHSVTLPNGDVMTASVEKHWQFGCPIAPESWVADVAKAVGPRRVQEIGAAAERLALLDDADPLLQQPGQPPQS